MENHWSIFPFRNCAEKDVAQLPTLQEQSSVISNPMYDSVSALSNMGGSYRDVALRVLEGAAAHHHHPPPPAAPSPPPHSAPSPQHQGWTLQ